MQAIGIWKRWTSFWMKIQSIHSRKKVAIYIATRSSVLIIFQLNCIEVIIINSNNYLVYMHVNKINDKKYIGITGVNPEKRWGNNGNGYTKNKQPLFNRAINKYGWNNFDHIILYENLTKEEACEKEIYLISYYNTQNPEYGYNIQPGGQLGNAGMTFSEDTKKKISDSHKGKQLSEEHKKKISESLKGHKPPRFSDEFIQKQRELNTGKVIPEEIREKISKTLTGVKRSPETLRKRKENNPLCVRVYCPELDMTFDTIADAAKYSGATRSNIQKCLKGERKTAGKHIETGEKLHWKKVEK